MYSRKDVTARFLINNINSEFPNPLADPGKSCPSRGAKIQAGDQNPLTTIDECDADGVVPLQEHLIPFWASFMTGGTSGAIGAVATSPLEVVKTRLQSSQHQTQQTQANIPRQKIFRMGPVLNAWKSLAGTSQAIRSIYVNEGPRALWKGIGPTIVGVFPSRAIYFSTYNFGKTLHCKMSKGGEETPMVHLTCATVAGIATATATNPIWVVKTKMQLQATPVGGVQSDAIYKSSMDCLRKVYRTEGLPGLYRGLLVTYIGVLESSLKLVLYERLKRELAVHRAKRLQINDPLYKVPTSTKEITALITWFNVLGIAALSKLVSAILFYPHEVLRTRLREDAAVYRGIAQTSKKIFQEEGVRAFYGGLTAHLLKVVPNGAILFLCYESFIRLYVETAVSRDAK